MKLTKRLLIIITGLYSLACSNLKSNDWIGKPAVTDYYPNDSTEDIVIRRIRTYLKNTEGVAIDSFFVDGVSRKMDTVVFFVHHYHYYVLERQLSLDAERVKQAERRGEKEIYVNAPPTGNWSGRDRAMIYVIPQDSLLDILYQ